MWCVNVGLALRARACVCDKKKEAKDEHTTHSIKTLFPSFRSLFSLCCCCCCCSSSLMLIALHVSQRFWSHYVKYTNTYTHHPFHGQFILHMPRCDTHCAQLNAPHSIRLAVHEEWTIFFHAALLLSLVLCAGTIIAAAATNAPFTYVCGFFSLSLSSFCHLCCTVPLLGLVFFQVAPFVFAHFVRPVCIGEFCFTPSSFHPLEVHR